MLSERRSKYLQVASKKDDDDEPNNELLKLPGNKRLEPLGGI